MTLDEQNKTPRHLIYKRNILPSDRLEDIKCEYCLRHLTKDFVIDIFGFKYCNKFCRNKLMKTRDDKVKLMQKEFDIHSPRFNSHSFDTQQGYYKNDRKVRLKRNG